MSSTSGTGNGTDESSSTTNTLITTPFSQSLLLQTTPPRTIEEAWRHINLASLSSSARVPFGNGVPSNSMVISSSTAADPTSLNFPPPMMQNHHYYQRFCINRPIIINPNQSLANSTSSSFGTGKKKKLQESDHSNSEDPRHKQMIKNRESAARSRAKKQAYTDELELEVQHLKEENARIKRQQQQQHESSIAAASGQPKKRNHRRSSTAPF